jgi:hypothetical protein
MSSEAGATDGVNGRGKSNLWPPKAGGGPLYDLRLVGRISDRGKE